MAHKVSKRRFVELVKDALKLFPNEFKDRFDELNILVEDMPTKEDSELSGVPMDELMGIFRGYEHRAYAEGFFEVPVLQSNEVVLFQKNIEAFCEDEDELIDEIRMTLLHEVGHYFGLTEDEIEEFERKEYEE